MSHKYPNGTKVRVNGRPATVITTPPGKGKVYVVLYEDGRAVEAKEEEMEGVRE